ncbi:hypothetical protein SERLADRAFT_393218 [Serpula lacrymans var. lacrymans S7.9]|uniref:DUF6533 domain-containing protein n=1 Tax=Serpula lacrymans var. lacrymans (strain S7.9) TaxID=578457 RepID=F8P0M7_SERL9|nr:uncharacterized protein SERLADRAFT_393218 [Serpula lacrymans var. lacrymans S7.9]EGO22711.1 hypothetical protein SERLADRAFT_393218 [Serpula lacrymans var. lacrymans S7.9]
MAEVARAVNLGRICHVSATILTLYDHMITLDQEVELIWQKRWSLLKVLFIWTRYLGDLVLICDTCVFMLSSVPPQLCLTYVEFQSWASTIIIWTMQIIMQFRIYAMYQWSKKIICFVAACFIIEVAFMFAVKMVSARSGAYPDLSPIDGVHPCIYKALPDFLYSSWVAMMSYESILFSFAVWMGIKHVKEMRALRYLRGGSIFEVLIRDSSFYFMLTLSTCAGMWLALPADMFEVPEGFSIAVTTIMGCRLVLNLREEYYRPLRSTSWIDAQEGELLAVEDLHFP